MLDLALFHQGETAEEEPDHEHEHAHHGHLIQIQMGESGAETAVDPICGMDVVIATARYTYEHEGQIYYFCCAGCREKFVETSRQLT
jgi:YHS domain-containing protein